MSSIARLIYQHENAHRVIPYRIAAVALRAQANREWRRDPDVRRQARAQMAFVVGESARAHEVEVLARRYVQFGYQRSEQHWRSWLGLRRTPANVERLRELKRTGRGVLVSFIHHGNHTASIAALCRAVGAIHMPVWRDFVDPTNREAIQMLKSLTRSGGIAFDSAGSREHIRALLHDGEIVAIACDMVGSMQMQVLGRDVLATSGTSRMALDTGAWIVPITMHPEGVLQRAVLETEIDPHDYTDPHDLQAAIIRAHEPALLAWPEALERPLRRWRPLPDSEFAWSQGTTLTV